MFDPEECLSCGKERDIAEFSPLLVGEPSRENNTIGMLHTSYGSPLSIDYQDLL
jgi:hypothetical protein